MSANETLKGLNSYLFGQLDALAKASKDDLVAEVQRAETMVKVGETVISTYNTQLKAVQLVAEHKGLGDSQQLPTIPMAKLEI